MYYKYCSVNVVKCFLFEKPYDFVHSIIASKFSIDGSFYFVTY